ncbi:MAG: creatininase family protein [Opitutaceae bacterium]|nr:creatininase family protein [Opitutaceae bacterium]
MDHNIDRRGFLKSIPLAAASFSGGVAAAVHAAGGDAPGAAATPGAKPFVNPRKVLLRENTRKEIREWIESGQLQAAILPAGSIEQHNEHMAMDSDIVISTLIAQQVALELYPQVIVAPPSPCGYSPYHMNRKGTVTLRKETFQAYLFDVLSSLKAHGIRTLFVLNGHGGNHDPMMEALPEWRRALGGTVDADSYFRAHTREFLKQLIGTSSHTSHAGILETSMYMAAFPERLRYFTLKEYDDAKLDYESGFSPYLQEFLSRDARSRPTRLPGENFRDRERQVEALRATRQIGEALITKATSVSVEKLRKMIAATVAGQPWPPPAKQAGG